MIAPKASSVSLVACSLSGQQATSFCCSAGCEVSAFCCDSCPGQSCLRSHVHGNLRITFIDQLSPSLMTLMYEDILWQRREQTQAAFQRQIRQLQSELEDIVSKHRQATTVKARTMKYKPEIASVLKAITEKGIKTINGDAMHRFMFAVDSKSYFIDESEYEELVKQQNGQLKAMIDRVKDSIMRFREHQQEDLKRSIIRADTLRKERKLEDSILEYSLALEFDPNNAKCYHKRAANHYQLNQFEEAIRCETEALKLEPNNYLYYNNRGLNYCGINKHKLALADFNEAIRLNPNQANLFKNRGDCYRDLGEYKKALSDYEAAVGIQPSNDNIFSGRAECYFLMGDYKSALSNLTEAIRLKPSDHVYQRNRGDIYYELKKFDQALSDYTRAIELKPEYSVALNNRGNTYFNQKNYDKAIADYNEAIRLEPANYLYYTHRSKALKKAGRAEEAARDQQLAAELQKPK